MNKIKNEEIEQLLKDLAANVGYDIIPAPFNTPFAEESFTDLPESKQFLWTLPTSVLNNEEHKPFRRMCVEADIIDTVCTTSFSWPSNKKDQVAIILVDLTRRRRGCIKFVDACKWDIADENGIHSRAGRIATGDFVLFEADKREHIKAEFDPIAFDMESAAVAQVATAKGIDFVSIRSFSDMANTDTIEQLSDKKELDEDEKKLRRDVFRAPAKLIIDYLA